jgi:uncharacterized protein YcbK (DUF882 family)
MDRRIFLQSAAGAAAFGSFPSMAKAEPPFPIGKQPPNEWRLWIQRQVTGEEYKETYVANGVVSIPGYNRLCHGFRDVRAPVDEQVVQIDLRLMNLMFSIQQWLNIHKQPRPLVVLSGYRTIKNNQNTEGASRNSMHVHGRAADFYIDGLSTQKLGDMVRWFQAGGVGLYAGSRFIHVDTGPLRTWRL